MLAHFRQSRILSSLLVTFVLWFSMQSSIHASMVSTTDLVTAQQVEINKETLLASLDREEVKEMLASHGVDPDQARERVANMTDEEVSILNQKLNDMPAGAGIAGVLLIVFLALLLTDILGYTDIFPFVKKQAK